MKALVFFSGGISSYCAARLAVEKYGAESTVLLFTDTKTEDEDLYRFIREASEKLGARLEWVSEGRDVWQVFNDIRFIGNSRLDPCSRILKREPAHQWIHEHAKPDTKMVFGFDEFEVNRTHAVKRNYLPWECEFPLLDKVISYSEKRQMLIDDGLTIPRLYELGFAHNNCGGFCVKAGQAHFANLYRQMPQRYEYHAEKEQELMAKGINHKGIIRMTRSGERVYVTLKDFKQFITGDMFDVNDVRGCGCFSETS